MSEPTRYAAYVVPELSHSRVEAQWSRISEQLPAPRAGRGSRRWMVAAAAVVALCTAGAVYHNDAPRLAESVWEGSLVASDDAPVNVTLAEGTLIELEPHSEVRLMRSSGHAVQVSLSEGSALFDVAKKRERRFSVQMGQVEVLVTGTQFRVARSIVDGGERVRVAVEEGSVEVHRHGATGVTLQAGDHWSAFVADDASDTSADEGSERALPEEEMGNEDELADQEGMEEDASEGEPSQDSKRARRQKRARASAEAAARLFDQANLARRSGRVSEAAKLYDELARQHPRDRRAALAAFELGRIRMDSLSDARGAIEALDRALKLDARRAFAEDALARLVLAHEALGDRMACMRARERYLSRYPEGVHASHVSARCGN